MPKGAHFKKENPRNHQVSFKVNQTELDQLRKLTEERGLSIPEWLRSHITTGSSTSVSSSSKPIKKAIKKKTNDSSANTDEQTSLF
ncbi:MAG: hypothetical protein OEX22_04625 [Cyclobacteriaceae bacterium]|nr:hypothetical protein [Cyclobacteriaceae bacterium]